LRQVVGLSCHCVDIMLTLWCVLISAEEFQKVVSENENVIVDCFATWCGPCKAIAPILAKYAHRPLTTFIYTRGSFALLVAGWCFDQWRLIAEGGVCLLHKALIADDGVDIPRRPNSRTRCISSSLTSTKCRL